MELLVLKCFGLPPSSFGPLCANGMSRDLAIGLTAL